MHNNSESPPVPGSFAFGCQVDTKMSRYGGRHGGDLQLSDPYTAGRVLGCREIFHINTLSIPRWHAMAADTGVISNSPTPILLAESWAAQRYFMLIMYYWYQDDTLWRQTRGWSPTPRPLYCWPSLGMHIIFLIYIISHRVRCWLTVDQVHLLRVLRTKVIIK